MNCMHVRVLKYSFGVFAVLRREFTSDGIIYHVCDDIGKYIGPVLEKYCEVL